MSAHTRTYRVGTDGYRAGAGWVATPGRASRDDGSRIWQRWVCISPRRVESADNEYEVKSSCDNGYAS